MEQLEQNQIDRNTLILFTGDNGPWMVQGTSGGSEGLLTGRASGALAGSSCLLCCCSCCCSCSCSDAAAPAPASAPVSPFAAKTTAATRCAQATGTRAKARRGRAASTRPASPTGRYAPAVLPFPEKNLQTGRVCRGSQGQIAPASRTAEIVSSLDLLPTASALAGVALPTDRVCKLTTAMHALLVVLFAPFFQHVRKLTRRALPFR